MRNHWISLIALSALVLAGCGALQTNGQNESPASFTQETLSTPLADTQPSTTEPPTAPQTSVPDAPLLGADNSTIAPRKIVEKAKADLVKQFGVDASQIRVVEAKAVDWPDASLGCPQPDMVYAQVITPGYWILLEAKGRQYPYHTDQNQQTILCLRDPSDPESLPLIPVIPGEIDDGQPWMPVD